MTLPTHSENIKASLEKLEDDAHRLNRIMIELIAPAGSPMFPLDFLAFAAVKRHASTTSGFISAINSWALRELVWVNSARITAPGAGK